MQPDVFTLYKLIILFIMKQVDFSLTNAQISNIFLEKDYTNYFNIQQVISELIETDLIKVKTIRNSSYYKLTDAGKETLDFFSNDIPTVIKTDIIDYLKVNKYALIDEASTLSDYYKSQKNEFIAHCIVKENNSPIIEINLSAPTEEDAAQICNNWRDRSQEVYAFLMKTLLSKKE